MNKFQDKANGLFELANKSLMTSKHAACVIKSGNTNEILRYPFSHSWKRNKHYFSVRRSCFHL